MMRATDARSRRTAKRIRSVAGADEHRTPPRAQPMRLRVDHEAEPLEGIGSEHPHVSRFAERHERLRGAVPPTDVDPSNWPDDDLPVRDLDVLFEFRLHAHCDELALREDRVVGPRVDEEPDRPSRTSTVPGNLDARERHPHAPESRFIGLPTTAYMYLGPRTA